MWKSARAPFAWSRPAFFGWAFGKRPVVHPGQARPALVLDVAPARTACCMIAGLRVRSSGLTSCPCRRRRLGIGPLPRAFRSSALPGDDIRAATELLGDGAAQAERCWRVYPQYAFGGAVGRRTPRRRCRSRPRWRQSALTFCWTNPCRHRPRAVGRDPRSGQASQRRVLLAGHLCATSPTRAHDFTTGGC